MRWISVLLAILIAGCTTTIQSQRIHQKPTSGEVGVVYQMSKPQFTIATTQPAVLGGPTTYTLQMAMVPDPERCFGVQVKPGTFTTANFAVTLNSNGALQAVTEAGQEQITTTITAIGQFAGSVIGAAATAAGTAGALMGVSVDDAYHEQIKVEVLKRLDTLDSAAAGATLVPGIVMTGALKNAAQSIEGRLNTVNTTQPDWDKQIVKTITPLSKDERMVMNVIADGRTFYSTQLLLDPIQSKYWAKMKPGNLPNAQGIEEGWEIFVGQVTFAVGKQDVRSLDYLAEYQASTYKATATGRLDPKARKIVTNDGNDLAIAAREEVLAVSNFPTIIGAALVQQTPSQKIYAKAQKDAVQILKLQAKLIGAAPAAKPPIQAQIGSLNADLADTIGAHDEYQQMTKLQQIVNAGPPSAANAGQSSPMNEYVSARAQINGLQSTIAAKLATFSATASASPPPPTTQPTWTPVPVDIASLWDVPRETWEGKSIKPLPILVPKTRLDSDFTSGELMSARAFVECHGDASKLPKYIVVLKKVQP